MKENAKAEDDTEQNHGKKKNTAKDNTKNNMSIVCKLNLKVHSITRIII